MENHEECLRGIIVDVRQSIDADQWTAAYVKLLQMNSCERRPQCSLGSECARVNDVFSRNIVRVQPDEKACG